MLNCQRGMHRADAVGTMKMWLRGKRTADRDFLDLGCNFGGKGQDGICQLIGRGVTAHFFDSFGHPVRSQML